MRASVFVRRHATVARWAIRRVSPNPVLVNVEGFKIYVRLDDFAVGAGIALRRKYESHVVHAMRPFLKPGAVVVDIGANIGFYTLLAASRVGSEGKVLAFEPAASNCELMRMSVEANGFDNVVIHERAVADTDRSLFFNPGRGSNGVVSCDPSPQFPLQVDAVALDSFLRAEPRIDVVKMDIEGAEGLALVGMTRTLQSHRPVLFTEFSRSLRRRSRMEPRAFLDRLQELGYELRVIPRKSEGPDGRMTPGDLMDWFARTGWHHFDLLVTPPGGGRPDTPTRGR